MIVLVGVAHVIDVAKPIGALVEHYAPGAVGIELDPGRYRALQEGGQRGKVPSPYRLLAVMQRRLADQFGGEVGAEMLAAANAAKARGSQVLLIDMEAGRMFDSLIRQMPFKEKVAMVLSSFGGLFMTRRRVERELQEFQENEERYMEAMGSGFPTVKRVLIDERNEHMARNILKAEGLYGSVLAVIGDGHVEGIRKLISREDLVAYRLKDLRDLRLEPRFNSSEASFTFTVGE